MAFGGFDKNMQAAPMAEINMIPLIDVMLVLLVIFIVAAPLQTHSVRIELPKASSQPSQTKPETIQLSIKADGTVYWNSERIEDATLATHMRVAANQSPQPEVHIRADSATPYQTIATVMSAAARAGLHKIGFVTDPSKNINKNK